jgi:hypothetical protein
MRLTFSCIKGSQCYQAWNLELHLLWLIETTQ